MKIGITGGGGFVGSTLCRDLLEQGYDVVVMDNMHKGNVDNLIPLCVNPKFSFIQGDITSIVDCKKFVRGVDAIVSLAAIVGSPACNRQLAHSFNVNVEGIKNLISARSKHQRIVFSSTESVYGPAACVETSSPRPTSAYASQKLQAEELLANTDNTISFRFAAGMGLSYTTRINLLVNTLVYEAIKNNVLVIYQGEVLRNFINVKDMSRCLQFGMTNVQLAKKVYNAGGVTTTKNELAELISKKTGCHVFHGDVGSDVDNRSQKLDTTLLTLAGFSSISSLDETLEELVRGIPLVNAKHNYD